MKKYILSVIVVCFASLSLFGFVNYYRYYVNRDLSVNGPILAYQLAKLDQALDVDTVFVGDSSLGNGLDAAYFDQLVGTCSLNLALTGSHHFSGTLNMIRRALASSRKIRQVVVVQSLWVWGGASSYDGYVSTVGGFWSVPGDLIVNLRLVRQFLFKHLDVRSAVAPKNFLPALRYAVTGERGQVTDATTFATFDYQSSEGRFLLGRYDNQPKPQLNPDAGRFLRQIGVLCQQRQIRCLYIHGPIYADAVASWRGVLPSINDRIVASGVTLVEPGLIVFGDADRGDTEFHIHPTAKRAFTRRYAELIAPYLHGDGR